MSGVIAAVGVSAGISIGSAYLQSERLKSNAAFQAKIAELNAQMVEVDAAEAYRQGIGNQTRAIGEIEKIKAQQEAAIASSGVNTGGAVADLTKESNLNASLNLLDLEQQAFNKRLGLQREADGIRTQSSVDQQTAETKAQNAMLSGYAQAAQTGLGAFKGKAKEADIKVGKSPLIG
jgi:hypothetical protein